MPELRACFCGAWKSFLIAITANFLICTQMDAAHESVAVITAVVPEQFLALFVSCSSVFMSVVETMREENLHHDIIAENVRLQLEIDQLRKKLKDFDVQFGSPDKACKAHMPIEPSDVAACDCSRQIAWSGRNHSLSSQQIERYSRQILLKSMGITGQHNSYSPAPVGTLC